MPMLGNFEELALALGQVEARLPEEIHRSLSEIGEVVERIAKAKIGTYQPFETSPQGQGFWEWIPLTEGTMADRVAQGFPANEPLERTGELRDSIEHEVEGSEMLTVGSDDPIARYQEIGTASVPPRPFIGPSMAESMDRNLETIADGIGRAFGAR